MQPDYNGDAIIQSYNGKKLLNTSVTQKGIMQYFLPCSFKVSTLTSEKEKDYNNFAVDCIN